MKSRVYSCVVVALPIVVAACATQPNFTYYDDTSDASPDAAAGRDGSATKPTNDATVVASPEASAEATAPVDDGPLPDAMEDGEAPDGEPVDAAESGDSGEVADGSDAGDGAPPGSDGGGMAEAGTEAGGVVEAGCGPLDTVTQCGACHNTCDTVHSDPLECAQTADASSCVYSGCSTGFADCDASAPNTNGCETPTTSLTNCGGCGVTCNTANSVDAGCNGSACTYSCAPGYGDCTTTAPNTGGCQALTTAASCGTCGNVCTGSGTSTCTDHVNALTNLYNNSSSNYYDCYAVNVHNYTTAHDACAAYTGDHSANNCQTFGCTGEPNSWAVVCSNEINGVASACVCWEYAGGQIGKYDTSCECPASFDPTWE